VTLFPFVMMLVITLDLPREGEVESGTVGSCPASR